jgi:dTDP-glucose 4,6-dehydratase
MRRRRVVVTGGAGFVGSHLCERMLDLDFEVLCIDSYLTGRRRNIRHLVGRPGFHVTVQDVADPVEVDGPVHAVLHLASPASPVDYLRYPVETLRTGALGTLNLLELAEAKGARFLLASTSETYGDPLVHPQPETYWGNVNPVGPRSVYDEAKRFAEAATSAFHANRGVDTRIIRIFNTFGPRMRANDGRVIPTFIHQALAGRPLTVAGDGSQTRSVCYVDDLVDGIVAMLHADHPGPVNLGNPRELTVLEIAALIRELTGSGSSVTFVDRPVDDPSHRRPDIGLAKDVLGWEPQVGLEDGLLRTIAWFRRRAGSTAAVVIPEQPVAAGLTLPPPPDRATA